MGLADEIRDYIRLIESQRKDLETFNTDELSSVEEELERKMLALVDSVVKPLREEIRAREELIQSLREEIEYLKELSESQRGMMGENLNYMHSLREKYRNYSRD